MTLADLVTAVQTLGPEAGAIVAASGRGATTVTAVAHDSRAVTRGTVFVAIPGHRVDGAAFAAEAIRRGALAIVAETAAPPDVEVPWLPTTDARVALADLAAVVSGHPSRRLTLVGVTGTNGKTTSTYLLASIFDAAGMPSGRIGTVSFRVGPSAADEQESSHTTPEAPGIQRMLATMIDRGCTACAMEVSSHALALHRVDGLHFAAAVFTNLTRDHLDFHGDMPRYFAAKRRLFAMLPPGAPSAINIDDPRGVELAAALNPVITFGIDRPADVRPRHIEYSLEGVAFEVDTPRGPLAIRSPLIGRPNVSNILGAVAVAVALDLPLDAIERGVAALDRVPGRFELVSTSADDVRVVVDYAHTDDALKHLLETARPLAAGRIVTVFGCGGDRDRSKRPLMGAVAGRLSDVVVLTSDNPRSEDPERILDEIVRGLDPTPEPGGPRRTGTPYLRIRDRREAIDKAIRTAQPGDLVLVAGKGHEKYQVIGERTLPFDDVEVARGALAHRRSASRV
ncbi:MAG: UDP-N-acetylmuramoyl-L-alanyl-D-glutamate--2,6-diaminopimelate ligase [Acidobacteria bacterium SCN 69-37]|nr:MAG: UDP-N-acetylmuramoyl-L-alanyl-D-glutamate--2,6-diaminopimelate ligase [Acidobacteria bacterium SCN 69-37]